MTRAKTSKRAPAKRAAKTKSTKASKRVKTKTNTKTNPLLAEWKGPYGGVPPFDKVKVKDIKSGLLSAIRDYRQRINEIANDKAAPNFENTLVALERAGEVFNRVLPIYFLWKVSLNTPEFRKIESDLALKIAAFQDEIAQNIKLFKRIEAVYQSPEYKNLTTEQQRLTWLKYTEFVLKGSKLSPRDKTKVAKINQKLAALMTKFSQNVLGDEENDYLHITNKEDLAGLSESLVEAAALEAKRRKKKGWVFANTRSVMDPLLTSADSRAVREKAFRIFSSRGDQENKYNNNKVAAEILKLRTERAKILGYPTFAHWKLADKMAKDPSTAMELMMKIWRPAVAAVQKEVREMQEIVDREGGDFKIQPWDYRYYSEKVRKAKYDFDLDELKPYLRLDNVRQAMFWMAEQLYGLEFAPISGVPVFHRDVTVYEVTREGKKIGLWYFDPFARPGKNSGAWMASYREQHRMDGEEVTALVSNNTNFSPAQKGKPVFISWMDAVTMFHEFGHALHGLSSNVTYPSLSGTNTAHDFVELPSQVHENFLETREILKSLRDENGNPIPDELIEKIERTSTFRQGFETAEFLAAAIVDMKLHLTTEPIKDLRKFEEETLKEIGMPSEIIMRHRIPHFLHLFCSDSYAAGYYAYLWAQVLDSDAFEAFTETGNAFNRDVAKRFFENVLSVGNAIDPAEAYRQFRGRDAKVDALLRSRGFSADESSAS